MRDVKPTKKRLPPQIRKVGKVGVNLYLQTVALPFPGARPSDEMPAGFQATAKNCGWVHATILAGWNGQRASRWIRHLEAKPGVKSWRRCL